MTEDQFAYITGIVIDKLEGGYYHPQMMWNNPDKFPRYENSGETMFGLDRHAGHSIYYSTKRVSSDVKTNIEYIESGAYKYKNEASKNFWETIDKANAKDNWSWNYKGGNLNAKLKDLAGRVMYPQYQYLADRYLSPEARAIVESDPRLIFHFSYACWNGSGRFKSYAETINSAVSSGEKNKDNLVDIALQSRFNTSSSLAQQSATKIAKFIYDITFPSFLLPVKKKKTLIIIVSILVIAGFTLGTIFLIKTIKSK